MKLNPILISVLLTAASANASILFDTTSALTLANPTQTGRLSRNSVLQDWTGGEAFPGAINTTTVYHYTTYVINAGITPFLQIDFDSTSANTFASAYLTSYLPDSAGSPNFGFDTGWLGDEGASGNFFGTDARFFQVIVPVNTSLVVVVNNTAASNVGVGDTFHLTVEGYIDTNYDDPVATPEPGGIMLISGGGILLLGLRSKLRKA